MAKTNDSIPHPVGQGYWACRGDDGIWEVRKDVYSQADVNPFDDKYNGLCGAGRATTIEKAKALCDAGCGIGRDQMLNS